MTELLEPTSPGDFAPQSDWVLSLVGSRSLIHGVPSCDGWTADPPVSHQRIPAKLWEYFVSFASFAFFCWIMLDLVGVYHPHWSFFQTETTHTHTTSVTSVFLVASFHLPNIYTWLNYPYFSHSFKRSAGDFGTLAKLESLQNDLFKPLGMLTIFPRLRTATPGEDLVILGPFLGDNWNCSQYFTVPIGSMYGIYANIYHQYTPNVSI